MGSFVYTKKKKKKHFVVITMHLLFFEIYKKGPQHARSVTLSRYVSHYCSWPGFPCRLGVRVAQWVRSLDLTTHTSLSSIWLGFTPGFVSYKKGCTRLAAASDKVYQLLAHGRWFSPGTPASSTTKTGRHDIAEILLKVVLNQNQSNPYRNLTTPH